MVSFSVPSFSEELMHGLKGPRVTFSLQGSLQRTLNPRAVAIINEVFGGEWTEPELDGGPPPPE